MSIIDANQTINPPFESSIEVLEFADLARETLLWRTVGILSDSDNINVVIVLLDEKNHVIGAFRINAPAEETARVITTIQQGNSVNYRCWQGDTFRNFDIQTVESINDVWNEATKQEIPIDVSDLTEFFSRLEANERRAGRGKDFTKSTKESVYRAAHGRCMFTGCGENLGIEVITGKQGNYSYLAHNVASSEKGTRGIILASDKLSNDPENILLMCDKHHRLIDTVAACDYNASRLSKMRENFCRSATKLLDGLKYEAIPAYAVLWPVNSQVIATPSPCDIASSLSQTQKRLLNTINILSDNEDLLRASPDIFWQCIPTVIEKAAKKIIQQTKHNGHRAALFVAGPMPALIGLGALIGNKNHYIAMLMFRDTGKWEWATEKPVNLCYEMLGVDNLESGTDFVIAISLTARVPKLIEKAQDLKKDAGAQIIEVIASSEYMGSGATPHPENGKRLCLELQQLLHELGSKHNAKRVHLLVCASNAASVFIGQAFDNYHPDVIVYDFSTEGMLPRILLQNRNYETTVSLPNGN